MLCQFSFSNFRSYRGDTVFSMQATPMREFEDSLIPGGDKQRFLPVAAIYGPNAGGKSNLYYALEYVCRAVADPIVMLTRGIDRSDLPAFIKRCPPFAFDPHAADDPSAFEIYYRVKGYEYRYRLEVMRDDIVREELDRRKVGGSRTAMLFSREGGQVNLGPLLKKIRASASFNPAIPYLSFLRMNSKAEAVTDAADWFVGCTFLNYNSAFLELALERILDEADSDRITGLLRSIDIRIDGLRVEKSDDELIGQKVYVRHNVDGKTYELRLHDESAGTQKMIGLSGFLILSLHMGSPLFVDELDAKLHPKLLRFATLLYKDPNLNKHGAQLIFTSQDVSTMRNDVFRRDEIWFAAKDESESSQLWSLADVHEANGNLVSKNAAFDKQYLAGRYGADPYLTRMEEWVIASEQ